MNPAETMAEGPGLPPGLGIRPLHDDDLDAVLQLLDDLTEDVHGEKMADRSDLVAAWTDPDFHPSEEGVAVVESGGGVVAAAFVAGRGLVEVLTRRDASGQALLPTLLDLCIERARFRGEKSVSTMVGATDHGRRSIVVSRGMTVHHTGWVMELTETVDVPPREPGAGYAVRRFVPTDAPAVHEVIESAFSDWEGRSRHEFDEWARATIERPGLETPWSWVATHGDEVVGACIAFDTALRGTWVHHLAVSDQHRGAGLAQALLSSTFSAGRERGQRLGGLATDSRMGARSLYEKLGLRVTHTIETYELDLA